MRPVVESTVGVPEPDAPAPEFLPLHSANTEFPAGDRTELLRIKPYCVIC